MLHCRHSAFFVIVQAQRWQVFVNEVSEKYLLLYDSTLHPLFNFDQSYTSSGIHKKNVACSRRSDRGDSAKRCEQKKRTTTTRGCGRGESKGTTVRLLTKARSSIPDSGIPYDWSILTAPVSTKRFIKLTGNVTREQWDHTSGYLESMVKWFEISNTINVEYHPYHPYHRSEAGSRQRKVGPPNFTIYRF